MKKNILVVLIVFAAGIIFYSSLPQISSNINFINEVSTQPSVTTVTQTVTLLIDDGKTKREIKDLSASTALEALEKGTAQLQLNLVTKKYDFGTLVEQIGEYNNTQELAWIYFVNGKSGDVGADKKTLVPRDIVEWKYIKPEF